MQFLKSVLQIRAGEGHLVIRLGLILMLNALALEMGDVVAVAGFLGSVGASNILFLWIIDMILIIAVGSVQSLIVDSFNRLRLLRTLCLFFAGVFAGLALLFMIKVSDTLNYGLLFLIVEQQNIFLPLIFWLLASEIFSGAQSRRLFPVIASWSAIGQIVGLSLAAAAPLLLKLAHASNIVLLVFNMMLYLICWALLTFGFGRIELHAHQRATQKLSWRRTVTRGWSFIRRIEALRYLAFVTFCACVVLTIIDYQFLSNATQVFANQPVGSFQTFYGIYRLIMAILVILTQNLIANRLLERSGVKKALLFAPIIVLLSISSVLLAPGLLILAAARALIRLVNNSIDMPAQKAFLAFMPEDVRGAVSIFTDGYIFAAAAILASVLIEAVLSGAPAFGLNHPEWIYLAAGLLFALVGIIAMYAMYKNYDTSLFNWRLKRRQHTSSVLKDIEF